MQDAKNRFGFDVSDPDKTLKEFGIIGAFFVACLVIAIPVVLSWQLGPMIGLGFWKTLGLLLLLRFWFT